jgi:hypothetical protein
MSDSANASWTRSRRFRLIDALHEILEQERVPEVDSSKGPESAADLSRAPRTGVRLMIVILIGLALVAIYANVQKVRRDKIETVTIIPASKATPPAPPKR